MNERPLLSDDQLVKLTRAIKQNEPGKASGPSTSFADAAVKLGLTICVLAISYVASQIGSLTTDMALTKAEVTRFSTFTQAPRFTAENNEAADQRLVASIKDLIAPLVSEMTMNANSITTLRVEMDKRVDFISDIQDHESQHRRRLDKLEARFDALMGRLED